MTEEPELGIRRTPSGMHALGKVEYEIKDGEVVYMPWGDGRGHADRVAGRITGEPTLRDLSEGLIAVYGTDYGIHSPTWITRFTDMTRQAAAYRDETGPAGRRRRTRAFPRRWTGPQHRCAGCGESWVEAGPGGQPDIAGKPPGYLPCRAPPGRCPRAAYTRWLQVALRRPDARIEALRDTVSELLSMDEPRKRFAGMLSGLDIQYDLGEGHPLLGRRMPDLDLVTPGGTVRVFTLLTRRPARSF